MRVARRWPGCLFSPFWRAWPSPGLTARQGWDDTGVTAGLILVASGIFAALRPARPWLWAVAVGGWIPLLGIASSGNYGSLLALAVSFLGAYSGALVVKTIRLFR